ncbi:hypothetical protein EHV15_05235 [Paenibacillus oralis]|uniref:Uncharacterized protein n=1 Tax=Paenibacillus oralis TaxID=2490856 RepID=A0A3P3TYJ1_9BACL|nr:hypothetical protein [Paenibacillus oralis]RRJ62419.1 hypothetical protein EHV15_05235 [Paenibacillus oralis]
MSPEQAKVTASSYWVWTEKAEKADPKRHRAGERVWEHYALEAPQKWLDEGLIVDRSEYTAEGQADLFEFM